MTILELIVMTYISSLVISNVDTYFHFYSKCFLVPDINHGSLVTEYWYWYGPWRKLYWAIPSFGDFTFKRKYGLWMVQIKIYFDLPLHWPFNHIIPIYSVLHIRVWFHFSQTETHPSSADIPRAMVAKHRSPGKARELLWNIEWVLIMLLF